MKTKTIDVHAKEWFDKVNGKRFVNLPKRDVKAFGEE